jgi:hypothetical protein
MSAVARIVVADGCPGSIASARSAKMRASFLWPLLSMIDARAEIAHPDVPASAPIARSSARAGRHRFRPPLRAPPPCCNAPRQIRGRRDGLIEGDDRLSKPFEVEQAASDRIEEARIAGEKALAHSKSARASRYRFRSPNQIARALNSAGCCTPREWLRIREFVCAVDVRLLTASITSDELLHASSDRFSASLLIASHLYSAG